MSKVTLNWHVLSTHLDNWAEVVKYLQENPLEHVNIAKADEGGYIVSRPLPRSERGAYQHLYRAQGRNPFARDEKPDGKPPKGGPKGGPKAPPPGGSPGAGRVAEYTVTEAKAA